MKPIVAVFDTKPYDRDFLQAAKRANEIEWVFHVNLNAARHAGMRVTW